MKTTQSLPTYGQGLKGAVPAVWYDTAAVDGDRPPWRRLPVGFVYRKEVTAYQQEEYLKVKDEGRNDDWILVKGFICQRVDYSEFTDGGSTTGTLDLTASIPIGALVERAYLINNTTATGVSTLTIQIGDGTDADRYSTSTPSVATAATILSVGAVSGTAMHTAAKTPRITLTEDDDFSDVTAWAATVVIEYTGSAV